MSDSWGHTLTVLPPDGVKPHVQGELLEQLGVVRFPSTRTCAGPLCRERAEYVATYEYVTGRAGRCSRATRTYCRKHAESFAKKHRLAMPAPITAGSGDATPSGQIATAAVREETGAGPVVPAWDRDQPGVRRTSAGSRNGEVGCKADLKDGGRDAPGLRPAQPATRERSPSDTLPPSEPPSEAGPARGDSTRPAPEAGRPAAEFGSDA